MKIVSSNSDLSQLTMETQTDNQPSSPDNADGFFFDVFSSLFSKVLLPLQDTNPQAAMTERLENEVVSDANNELKDELGLNFLIAQMNPEILPKELPTTELPNAPLPNAMMQSINETLNKNEQSTPMQVPTSATLDPVANSLMQATTQEKLVLPEISQQVGVEINGQQFNVENHDQDEVKNRDQAPASHKPVSKLEALIDMKQTQPVMANEIASNTLAAAENNPLVFTPKKSAQEEDNKYLTALSDMSKVLTAPMTQNANDKMMMAATIKPGKTNFTDTINQTMEQQYKIDTVTTAIDPMKSDTYNANIKLYPPELGHILAKLKIDNNNNAQLIISTESDRVKEVVQTNLPQLREHFQQANINITHIEVQVDANNHQNQSFNQPQQQSRTLVQSENNPLNQPATTPAQTTNQLNALVDTYA